VAFSPPIAPDSDPDERGVLLSYIRWQREQVVATVHGLTEEELRWTPGDRLLPIVGIINHLTHMEWLGRRPLPRFGVPCSDRRVLCA